MDKLDNAVVPGVKVEARIVPLPRSISTQARKFLEKMIQPDGSLITAPPLPPVDDLSSWNERRERGAKMFSASFNTEAAERAGCSVETRDIDGVTVHVGIPANPSPDAQRRAYIDIHGGAFYAGAGEPCKAGALQGAHRHGVWVYAIDYRTPPEHPYPAPLDDCLTVYRWALDHYGSSNIVVGGVSAGSNLAAAMLLRARDEGLSLPAAAVLLTPEVDLTESGDSFEVNRTVDVVLQRSLADSIAAYAPGQDLSHPYLSPLFGDYTLGFPPTFLQAGTRDLFLSNAARLHRALRRAGVPAELHVFDGMPHGGFNGAPEDADLAQEVDRFVATHWSLPEVA